MINTINLKPIPIIKLIIERYRKMGRSKKGSVCPRCGSTEVILQDSTDDGVDVYVCVECDREFEVGAPTEIDLDDDLDDRDDPRGSDQDDDDWN